MNISHLRPDSSSQLLEMALNDLHIEHEYSGNNELNDTLRQVNTEESEEVSGNDEEHLRVADERALMPRVSSLENSLLEHLSSSIPSLDEMVIRQRGRKKQPAKISWSPVKSPFKTPTKRNNTLHMSLLSPSPAKKLFNNSTGSSMILRSSPRKRLLIDASCEQDFGSCSSSSMTTPVSSTPTKRLKFSDERSMNANNKNIPLKTLLKAMSQNQLIGIICDIANKNSEIERDVCENLPVPDVRPFEDELCALKKNITRSLPRSRLLIQSKTDNAAYLRASSHLALFKKSITNHCKILQDSHAFDALIDYVLIAWPYVRGLPVYDEPQHNAIRKDCFKLLTLSAKSAFKHGGNKIGSERIKNFSDKCKSMANDNDEIEKCRELISSYASKIIKN